MNPNIHLSLRSTLVCIAVLFGTSAIPQTSRPTAETDKKIDLATRSCGPQAAFLALRYFDHSVDLDRLVAQCAPGEQGVDMRTLRDAMRTHGLQADAVRMNTAALANLDQPFIALVNGRMDAHRHYIFIPRIDATAIHAIEYPAGYYTMSFSDFIDMWTGTGIIVSPPRSRSLTVALFVVTVIIGLELLAGAFLLRKRMRSTRVSALPIALALFYSASSHAAQEIVHDLGTFYSNQNISHQFHLRNDGNQTIDISIASRSCKCIIAEIQKSRLTPGEETLLTVTGETTDKLGRGSFKVSIKGMEEMRLYTLAFTVKKPFYIDRTTISTGTIANYRPSSFDILINIDESSGSQFPTIAASQDWIEAFFIRDSNSATLIREFPVDSSGKRQPFFLRIILRPNNQDHGPFAEFVRLNLADATVNSLNVKLEGTFQGRCLLTPTELTIFTSGSSIARDGVLNLDVEEGFEIERVDVRNLPEWLRLKGISPSKNGGRTLSFEFFDAAEISQTSNITLNVRLNSAADEILAVPVSVIHVD